MKILALLISVVFVVLLFVFIFLGNIDSLLPF